MSRETETESREYNKFHDKLYLKCKKMKHDADWGNTSHLMGEIKWIQ